MATAANHLIERLPRTDRSHLIASCEQVPLVLAAVLCDARQSMPYVYFLIDGFISMIAVVKGRPGVAVAMVGREGMVGAHLVLGVHTSPLNAVLRGTGCARRMGVATFRKELAQSTALQQGVNRYLFVLLSQLATSVACLRFHLIRPCLARWLLMSEDRAHSKSVHATQ